jgi:hypothetical protein
LVPVDELDRENVIVILRERRQCRTTGAGDIRCSGAFPGSSRDIARVGLSWQGRFGLDSKLKIIHYIALGHLLQQTLFLFGLLI